MASTWWDGRDAKALAMGDPKAPQDLRGLEAEVELQH
eukprot:CAMPEP_0198710964 /NCGR_PEP_ID=MMETSP1471-20131121/3153_1 /TAXON_ID=41880 /ORGANISM="Pycnococcus provasolii, Strain RCC733" /LENGTH=36 /DNA_ID= /DNA_START= /DNA_END= /DNA_ORIENTATION=